MKIQRSAILLLLFLSLLANGQESATKQPVPEVKPEAFQFRGGNMNEFISTIDQYFKIELRSFADIPNSMRRVQVPQMRMPRPENFVSVLNFYNSVSEGYPELGMWIVKGEKVEGKPGVVVLTRGNSHKEAGVVNVRAFSCKGFDESRMKSFINEVERSSEQLRAEMSRVVEPEQFFGNVRYHSETDILLATGGDLYVKLVEELLQAFREQAQDSAPKDAKGAKK